MSPPVASIQGPQHSGRVYPFRAPEREALAGLPVGARILDLGCSGGANLDRLSGGGWVVGLDTSQRDLVRARRVAPVVAGIGEHLPFGQSVFDLVYVSHVLHHTVDHVQVLAEIRRVLKPGGLAFLIETFEDSPGIRLARWVHGHWQAVEVHSRFRFGDLHQAVEASGLEVDEGRQFNVVYWVWDLAQLRVPSLARLVRQAEWVELAADRRFRRWSAHGYLVARRPPSQH